MTESIISKAKDFYEQAGTLVNEPKISILYYEFYSLFKENFLSHFLKSIIAGEYLEYPDFYNTIDSFKKLTKGLRKIYFSYVNTISYEKEFNKKDYTNASTDETKDKEFFTDKILMTLQLIDALIKEVKSFYDYLFNYEITDVNSLYLYQKLFKIQDLEDYEEDISDIVTMLLIAMEIAYIEYLQIFNIETLKKLNDFYSYINRINDGLLYDNISLKEILKGKIQILYFAIKQNYKDFPVIKLIEDDGKINEINEYKVIELNKLIGNYKAKIDYYNSGYNKNLKKGFKLLDINKCEKIYFKIFEANKKEQSLNELNELLSTKPFEKTDIIETEENLNSKYNRSISTVNKLYLENCILSLKVNTKKFSSSIDDDISYQNNNQANYYQITRKIDYLKERFNNNSIPIEDYENIKNYLKEDYIPKLNQLRLSQITNSTVPFKFPIDECIHIINFNNTSYKILLLNTVIKYYSPEHTKEKIENGIFTAYELINRIEAFKTNEEARKLVSDTKQVVDDTRKDIKNSERRSIEIISVFAAIVIFAAGAINIVPRIETVEILISSYAFVRFCSNLFYRFIAIIY